MQHLTIDFEIVSTSSSQAFQTVGTLQENTLVFVDPDDQCNELQLFEDRIIYDKTGETILHLDLDLVQITTATYQIGNQTMKFQVHTQDILISDGFISVLYTLYQDREKINETQIKLRYKTQKEDPS